MLARELVGGMHLHGKVAFCVDELHQHGQFRAAMRVFPEILGMRPKNFVQRHPDPFPACGDAHAVRVRGTLPGLGHDVGRDMLGEVVVEARAAPEVVL